MRNREKYKLIKFACYISIFLNSLGINFLSFRVGSVTVGNTRIGFAILMIAWIFSMVVHRDFRFTIDSGSKKYHQFMLIWMFYGIINVYYVRNWQDYLTSVEVLIQAFFYGMIFSKFLRDYEDIINGIRAFCIAGIVHNIIAWYEYSTGNYLFVLEDTAWTFRRWKNPVSAFGNCNDLATFLLFVMVMAFFLFFYDRRRRTKGAFRRRLVSLLWLGLSISSAILVVLTGSRANMLAFLPIVIVGVVLYNHGKWTVKRFLVFLLGATVFIAVTVYIVNTMSLIEQVQSVFRNDGVVQSNSTRMSLIKNGLLFLVDSHFLGIGAGSGDYWLIHYPHYRVGVHKFHNWFIEILSSYGLIIFVMYILVYASLMIRGNRMIRRDANIKSARYYCEMIFVVCLAGYMIANISSGSNFRHTWIWAFWGLAIAAKCTRNTVRHRVK